MARHPNEEYIVVRQAETKKIYADQFPDLYVSKNSSRFSKIMLIKIFLCHGLALCRSAFVRRNQRQVAANVRRYKGATDAGKTDSTDAVKSL